MEDGAPFGEHRGGEDKAISMRLDGDTADPEEKNSESDSDVKTPESQRRRPLLNFEQGRFPSN
jgi:hypothetical protein